MSAVLRYLDMYYPEINMNTEKMAFIGIKKGFAGPDSVGKIPRSMQSTDLSMFLQS
jgi:hypothetical protein